MFQRARHASKLEKWSVGSGYMINRTRSGFTYEFQPADVWVIRQISSNVAVIHHFVKEGKWMSGSRIYAEEGNYVRVREPAGCTGFLEESLRVRYQHCHFNRTGGR